MSSLAPSLHRALSLAATVAAGLAVTWAAFETWRVTGAQMAAGSAKHQVESWNTGATAPDSAAHVQQVLDDLDHAARRTPDDPAIHEAMGDAYVAAGRLAAADSPDKAANWHKALAAYQAAVQLRPLDPQTFAAMAGVHDALQQQAPMWAAWREALKLGPHEGYVQPILLDILFANWAHAPADAQQWAKNFFEHAKTERRKAINAIAGRHGLELQAPALQDTR